MKCRFIRAPGHVAIVCGTRTPHRRKCSAKGCGEWSTLLCDYPVARFGHRVKSCDKPLCASCALRLPDGRDHCPSHGSDLLGALGPAQAS